MEVKKKYVAVTCGSSTEETLYGVSFQYVHEIPSDAAVVGCTDFSEVSSVSDELILSCKNKSVCVAVMPVVPSDVEVLGYIYVGDSRYVKWCSGLDHKNNRTQKALAGIAAAGVVVIALAMFPEVQSPGSANTAVKDKLLIEQRLDSDQDRNNFMADSDVELDKDGILRTDEQKETAVTRQVPNDSPEYETASAGNKVNEPLAADTSDNDTDKSGKKRDLSRMDRTDKPITRPTAESSYYTDTGNIPHAQTFTDIVVSDKEPTYVLTNGNGDAVGNIHYEMDILSGTEIRESLAFDLAPESSQEIDLYEMLAKGKYEVYLTTEYSNEELCQYNNDSMFRLTVK